MHFVWLCFQLIAGTTRAWGAIGIIGAERCCLLGSRLSSDGVKVMQLGCTGSGMWKMRSHMRFGVHDEWKLIFLHRNNH